MRATPRLFAIVILCSIAVAFPASAQSTSKGFLPRLSEVFGAKKKADTDKKPKTSAPAAKTTPKANEPPTITINRMPPSTDAPLITVEEKSSRLMEILVELALLADPVTFPYLLEARVEGQNIRVRGTVASKGVREHALKVVRMHCPLPAVDAMKENPGAMPKRTPTDARNLEVSASSALKQAFPKELPFEVKCGADGKAEVSGFVSSFEEKLRISQSLRRLHGCTHVVNQVHVLADERTAAQPKAATTVTPAGNVPTPVFRKSSPQPLPINPANDPSLPAVPKVSSADPADVDLLPILDRVTEQPMKMAKSLKDFPAQTAKNSKPIDSSTSIAKTESKNETGIRTVSAQSPSEEKPAFSTASPAIPVITPTDAMPVPFPVPPPPTPQQRSLPPPATVKVKDSTPQMLPGVPASLPSKLKAEIEAACGPGLRDVHVEVLSPTNLLVQFRANTENEGRQLARKLLTLPELQRYRVEVKVKVPQP